MATRKPNVPAVNGSKDNRTGGRAQPLGPGQAEWPVGAMTQASQSSGGCRRAGTRVSEKPRWVGEPPWRAAARQAPEPVPIRLAHAPARALWSGLSWHRAVSIGSGLYLPEVSRKSPTQSGGDESAGEAAEGEAAAAAARDGEAGRAGVSRGLLPSQPGATGLRLPRAGLIPGSLALRRADLRLGGRGRARGGHRPWTWSPEGPEWGREKESEGTERYGKPSKGPLGSSPGPAWGAQGGAAKVSLLGGIECQIWGFHFSQHPLSWASPCSQLPNNTVPLDGAGTPKPQHHLWLYVPRPLVPHHLSPVPDQATSREYLGDDQ
ncbi:uncharacterized protein LOC130454704 [Monodelphis domestica]|uniref:uncharacterized protein LOC130454704 n=1 Tax=Monodelphis domestica TaxID=13616 RepID=UPI0024E211BF|nr:uncharacterized protein LOC130454704 [Monodelphis domestica]